MHWSLSLVACLPHLCICILTFAFLHRSVWRSSSLSCVSWGLSSIYFTLSEPATTPSLVQRTTFCVIAVSWSVLTVIWACDLLHDGPAYYQLCKPDNFFFSSPLWFEPGISSTKAHHSANCASQTAVLMWGIIFVYMLKLIDVFPLKKKKSFGLRSRDPRLER